MVLLLCKLPGCTSEEEEGEKEGSVGGGEDEGLLESPALIGNMFSSALALFKNNRKSSACNALKIRGYKLNATQPRSTLLHSHAQ